MSWKKITYDAGQLIQQYQSGLLTEVAGAPQGLTPAGVLDWASQMTQGHPAPTSDTSATTLSDGIQELPNGESNGAGNGDGHMDPAKAKERIDARLEQRGLSPERFKKREETRMQTLEDMGRFGSIRREAMEFGGHAIVQCKSCGNPVKWNLGKSAPPDVAYCESCHTQDYHDLLAAMREEGSGACGHCGFPPQWTCVQRLVNPTGTAGCECSNCEDGKKNVEGFRENQVFKDSEGNPLPPLRIKETRNTCEQAAQWGEEQADLIHYFPASVGKYGPRATEKDMEKAKASQSEE